MKRGREEFTGRHAIGALLLAAICASAGWLTIHLPWVAQQNPHSPFFGEALAFVAPDPVLWTALIGAAAGLASPRLGLICAPALVLPSLVAVAVDVARDPSSHNLIFLELPVYGLLAVGAAVAAWSTGFLRKLILGPRPRPSAAPQ